MKILPLLILLPIATASCLASIGVVDSFGGDGLGEYTLSRLNDGNPEANAAFIESGGKLQVTYTGANSHEQVVILRGDLGLAIGEMLSVSTSFPSNSMGYDFGLVVAATATPVALQSGGSGDVRASGSNDWISISLRPNQDAVRLNRAFGTNFLTSGLGEVGGVNESTITSLFIERVSQYVFKLGYTTASNAVVVVNTFTAPDGSGIGGAIGFYADVRSNGSALGGMDNLRISLVPDASDRGTVIMVSSVGPWFVLGLAGLWFAQRRRPGSAAANQPVDSIHGPG